MNLARSFACAILVLLCFPVGKCKAIAINNLQACTIIKRTLGECYDDGDSLVFMQSSKQLGNVVTFYRSISERSLKIQCHSQFGIDLNRLPDLSFEEVKTIELHQCSMSNESVLTRIKSNFGIKRVQKLILRLTDVALLTHQHFKDLRELEIMELTAGEFTKFDSSVFRHFPELKSLKLMVYDVITLPYNVFKLLWKLETLELVNRGRMKNDTKSLNFTLNACINLKHFQLIGVRWPIHVSNLLTHNRFLQTVRIADNRVKSLSEKTFWGSSELKEIHLANNEIQSLPADIFTSQSELIKLALQQNQITMLDDNIFLNNTDLKSLDLSHNKLNFTSR